jgi:glycine hydroxymethyltransferase
VIGLKLSKEVSAISGPKLIDFKRVLSTDENIQAKIAALKEEVEAFSKQFTIPGYEIY